ncbi:MAG: DsrE family protein [Pirellulaceae bacterium]
MSDESKEFLIILTEGKSDNGRKATIAFSMALSALAMGHPATVFLTSDGAVWGYRGSARQVIVPGFSPLAELIQQFIEGDGRILLCSTCHRTCGIGDPDAPPTVEKLDAAGIAGMATILEIAASGCTMTF